jgi:hypothetical protein
MTADILSSGEGCVDRVKLKSEKVIVIVKNLRTSARAARIVERKQSTFGA